MPWKISWKYETIDYKHPVAVIQNMLLHIKVRNNLCGEKIRFKFSNIFGQSPLVFDNAFVSIGQKKYQVMYRGKEKITIPPGTEFYSDETGAKVTPGIEFMIEIQIRERTEVNAFCSTWASQSWSSEYIKISQDLEKDKILEKKQKIPIEDLFPLMRYEEVKPSILFGISQVEVLTGKEVNYVYTFGDSITHMSYYTDPVMMWLCRNRPGEFSLINAGVCGNRVLHDGMYVERFWGHGGEMGEAGIKRIIKDIEDIENIHTAIILEGINDIIQPFVENKAEEKVSAVELCKGIEKLTRILKNKSKYVYLATITPFQKKDTIYALQCENLRQACNEWIRTQNIADDVIDFDCVVKDKEYPVQMKHSYCMNDGIHPGISGGMEMAKEVVRVCFGKENI